jgi:hypothetical protein
MLRPLIAPARILRLFEENCSDLAGKSACSKSSTEPTEREEQPRPQECSCPAPTRFASFMVSESYYRLQCRVRAGSHGPRDLPSDKGLGV